MCSLQVPLLFWMVFMKVAVSFKMMTCTLSHGPICGLIIWFIDSTNQIFFYVCVYMCRVSMVIWHNLVCFTRSTLLIALLLNIWFDCFICYIIVWKCGHCLFVCIFFSLFPLQPCTRSQRSHHVYDCPTAIAIFTNWIWRHIGGYMGYENITNEIEN